MAFEKDWSHAASSDLNRIVEYHDARDPDWTDAIVTAIMEKFDSLLDNPYLSPIHKLTRWGEVRVALAGSYRLFFRINEADQFVRLERILHAHQQDPDFPV
jgi:plasmid stabilization system protein ParE